MIWEFLNSISILRIHLLMNGLVLNTYVNNSFMLSMLLTGYQVLTISKMYKLAIIRYSAWLK